MQVECVSQWHHNQIITTNLHSLGGHSLVPRLFLVEERAWQHCAVGAVYFRYIMVHVIYSDHALFLKIIM